MTSLDSPPANCGADALYRRALDRASSSSSVAAAASGPCSIPHDLPHCGADRLSWFEPDGAGVVYSTTVVRRKPKPAATTTSRWST